MEDDDGFAMVGGARGFAVATFFGNAKRGEIGFVNDAADFFAGKGGVFPGVHGVDSFGGEAFAVSGGQEDPAGFEHAFERRGDVALVFLEAAFTEKLAGGFFFDDPIAKAHEGPVADVTEQTVPGFFVGERLADELGDARIAPEGGTVGEVVEGMRAQAKARGFEDGNDSR